MQPSTRAVKRANKRRERQERKAMYMCKILLIPGFKPEVKDKAWNFARACLGPMTINDKDGIGYAGITPDGMLLGERWVDPKDAFLNRKEVEVDAHKEALMDSYMGALLCKDRDVPKYNHFGDTPRLDEVTSLMLHARMSTNTVNLANTHPFVIDNTALIHNGVIRNVRELSMPNSTCDSEGILTSYLEEGVKADIMLISEATTRLQGYYACGVLGVLPDGVPYMDIFKDNNAPLVAAFINELDTLVFASNMFILDQACKDTGFTMRSTFEFAGEYIVRLNAVTGAVMDVVTFTSAYMGPGAGKTTHTVADDDASLERMHDDHFSSSHGYSRNPTTGMWERKNNY